MSDFIQTQRFSIKSFSRIKKASLICAVFVIAIGASVLYLKWDAIFQKGNPVPYLIAAAQLSGENTYAAVDGQENVYISKRGERAQLFEDFQKTNHLEFVDQLGSGYLFTDGANGFLIISEIYWGKYTVWTLPADSFKLDNA